MAANQNNVRVSLDFSKCLITPSTVHQKVLFLLKKEIIHTVEELKIVVIKKFLSDGLREPPDIDLFVGECMVPPWEDITIFRENDIISVSTGHSYTDKVRNGNGVSKKRKRAEHEPLHDSLNLESGHKLRKRKKEKKNKRQKSDLEEVHKDTTQQERDSTARSLTENHIHQSSPQPEHNSGKEKRNIPSATSLVCTSELSAAYTQSENNTDTNKEPKQTVKVSSGQGEQKVRKLSIGFCLQALRDNDSNSSAKIQSVRDITQNNESVSGKVYDVQNVQCDERKTVRETSAQSDVTSSCDKPVVDNGADDSSHSSKPTNKDSAVNQIESAGKAGASSNNSSDSDDTTDQPHNGEDKPRKRNRRRKRKRTRKRKPVTPYVTGTSEQASAGDFVSSVGDAGARPPDGFTSLPGEGVTLVSPFDVGIAAVTRLCSQNSEKKHVVFDSDSEPDVTRNVEKSDGNDEEQPNGNSSTLNVSSISQNEESALKKSMNHVPMLCNDNVKNEMQVDPSSSPGEQDLKGTYKRKQNINSHPLEEINHTPPVKSLHNDSQTSTSPNLANLYTSSDKKSTRPTEEYNSVRTSAGGVAAYELVSTKAQRHLNGNKEFKRIAGAQVFNRRTHKKRSNFPMSEAVELSGQDHYANKSFVFENCDDGEKEAGEQAKESTSASDATASFQFGNNANRRKPEIAVPAKDYSAFPALYGAPRPGDVIAYKVLELAEDYSPGLSDYKEAQVVSHDPAGHSLVLQLTACRGPGRRGRFHCELEDEEGTLTVQHEYVGMQVDLPLASLVEPRLVS